jgi:uncharacterized protein (DUF305 family)
MMRLAARALALASLAAVVTACGDDEATSPPATAPAATTPTGSSAVPAGFNDADVAFVQQMIPHHEQAIEMAYIALAPAAAVRPEVTALATPIKAAQQPEIDTMTSWLEEWDQPSTMPTDGHEMGGTGGMGDGMMSDDEMSAMSAVTGPAFDTFWLQSMITHHQGAITMAQAELQAGSYPGALDLAGRIMSAQRAEINEMQALLGAS